MSSTWITANFILIVHLRKLISGLLDTGRIRELETSEITCVQRNV
jgi:hypothetical protein